MVFSEVLTPLQKKFLALFFQQASAKEFFLTGGTALAAYYLGHRYSEDLDIFTLDKDAFRGVAVLMTECTKMLDVQLKTIRTLENIHQYFIQNNEETVKIDIVREIPVQFGAIQIMNGVRVDALENIAVNKVTTILSRTEIKDFVDLYFILQKGFAIEDLIRKGKDKDLGLTEFYFAANLLNVKNFDRLPRMIIPLELKALQEAHTNLANSILDRINPTT